jgi:hypothetical protein
LLLVGSRWWEVHLEWVLRVRLLLAGLLLAGNR